MNLENEDLKKLCVGLIFADSEKEVIDLLDHVGLWQDEKVWRHYGDYENNYNTIGNQQSRPEAALVEKIVNSLDARLMNECYISGIDPEGPEAPKTIREAVAHFFDKKTDYNISTAGLISMWTDTHRTEVAKGISLYATGNMPSEGYPCFTIADCGEGQTPEMMPETFLSLTKSNKLRIPFVQGKYNMGGTGALKFCGGNNLQLIVSKRNPAILDGEKTKASDFHWGFTVVRREYPEGGVRNSIFTYLAPIEASENPGKGLILHFDAPSLPIFPEGNKSYVRESKWGSLIKLYEYEVTGFKTNILRKGGLLSRIDLLLPNLALPVRLHECRKEYRGHKGSFDTNLNGIGVRLEDDKAENLEFDPSSSEIKVMGERMNATIYAFKKQKAETYRRNEGVIFTLNGQTHGHFTIDFFRRKKVGLSYLADSILVIIDCSKISVKARENLFMNSRDRLSGGDLREEIERSLEDLLKNHQGLRALKERRRREEIESKVEEDKPLEEILEDLLKNSPNLANFLLKGSRLQNPFKPKHVGEEEKEFQGKRYPTYFKFKDINYGETLTKDCYINLRSRIYFETDAVDEYLNREVDPGEFSLHLVLGDTKIAVEDYIFNLHKGIATLNLQLPLNCREGDALKYIAELTDRTQLEPYHNQFEILVKGEGKGGEGGVGKRGSPSKKNGGKREVPSTLALPKIKKVYESEWEQHSPTFNEQTGLRIKHAGTEEIDGNEQDIYDFYINTDNIFLKTEMKAPTIEPQITEAKFIYGMVLLGLALLKQDSDNTNGKDISNDDDGENIEDKVDELTKAAAMVILPIIDELSRLDLEEIMAFAGNGEAT